MNILEMFVVLFGGLGLFLYGMNMMGDGLQNIAGDKLKGFFEKLTSNPIKGILTGAIITAIIQSSSATTVMVVGFVNAQLMNLFQSTALIMGANIGTTITSQLITLDIMGIIPIFIGGGAITVLFAKKDNVKQIGSIILGFGILFFGMDIMKDSMAPLEQSPVFIDMLKALDGNMFLGLLTGMVMTAILQSSSATTGILIALAGTGIVNITMIIPILFGCNIGTCVTSLISSIGTSKTARKAAVIHLLFNSIGTIIFLPLFSVLAWMVTELPVIGSDNVERQIANAHTIFNIVNTVILIPFIPLLVKWANKIIKGEDETERYGTKYIDERLLETPSIAIAQTVKDIERMGNKAKENLGVAMEAFKTGNEDIIEKAYKNESLINKLEEDITQYLVEISKLDLSEKDSTRVVDLLHMVNDIERIADHADNIADFATHKAKKKVEMSEGAAKELQDMVDLVQKSLDISLGLLGKLDEKKLEEVMFIEKKVDYMERDLRKSHIGRLNAGVCNALVGTMYLDIISNLERISDLSLNVAQYQMTHKN
ncbi:MAG: Na/Pi cotransporter family protein [Clostridium sp.]|uniref:Na/Pi cotransporter family protein n=1 Tax=Clostridium sp. TaxID=1506 RepID=UPI002FCBFCA3